MNDWWEVAAYAVFIVSLVWTAYSAGKARGRAGGKRGGR